MPIIRLGTSACIRLNGPGVVSTARTTTFVGARRPRTFQASAVSFSTKSLVPEKTPSIQDPQMKMAEMVNFLKNIGLIGLLLMLAAIPWPLTLGRR